MNLNRRLEPLPELDINLPERHQTLLLAAVLIVGLTFVAPLLTLLTGIPALVFVAVVGLLYGTLAVLFRQVLAGSLVGLLVTSTFAANVPLASDSHISSFPAHLGPELWLAQISLVVSTVLILIMQPREILAGVTKSEGLFATFVGWTVLTALFGATMRLNTALYFSLLMAQGLAIFALLRYAVHRAILPFDLVLQVFVGTVLAQSLFAIGQLLNSGIFGVTTLGEFGRLSISTLSLGPLGDFAVGTYVAGFTGMSFTLASMIVLAVPIAIMFALRESGWLRVMFVLASLLMMAVLRATGTDAGRGGLALTLISLFALLVYSNRSALLNRIIDAGTPQTTGGGNIANAIWTALMMIAGIVALLYPSSASGTSSATTNIGGGSSSSGASGGSTDAGSVAGGSNGAGGATNTGPDAVEALLQDLSIPFFDIGNLGIRLKQYVAGIDLFLQHPIFGIGGANFMYYSSRYGFTDPLPLHNIYIALLAETGLPGLVLYSSVLVSILWYGLKAARRTTNGPLLMGALCGVVGFLGFGFWDTLQLTQVPSFFVFWAIAGAVVGEYRATSPKGV